MSYSDFLDAISEDGIFEEKPVDLKTFLYGNDFLKMPPLSKIQ